MRKNSKITSKSTLASTYIYGSNGRRGAITEMFFCSRNGEQTSEEQQDEDPDT